MKPTYESVANTHLLHKTKNLQGKAFYSLPSSQNVFKWLSDSRKNICTPNNPAKMRQSCYTDCVQILKISHL